MGQKRRIIVTSIAEEKFQKLLEDQEISRELQKIVDSQYFSEHYKSLEEKIKATSLVADNENDALERFYSSPKEEVKKEIMNCALRQTFSKSIDNLLSINVREDVLNRLRNEESVKKIIEEASSLIENLLQDAVREIVTSGIGPVGDLFKD